MRMSSMQMVSKLDMPLPLYLRLGTCSWLCWATLLPSKPRLDLSSLHFYSRENVQKSNPTPPVSPAFHKSHCKYIREPRKPSSVFQQDEHLKVIGSRGSTDRSARCPPSPQIPVFLHSTHFFIQNLVLIFKEETEVSKSSAILL